MYARVLTEYEKIAVDALDLFLWGTEEINS